MRNPLVLLLLSLATLLMIGPSGHAAGVRPTRLRCEYLVDPLGIEISGCWKSRPKEGCPGYREIRSIQMLNTEHYTLL